MGGPLCGEKKAPFYTESSKKSISLGNLTILSFQIKHILSHTRVVQDIHFFVNSSLPSYSVWFGSAKLRPSCLKDFMVFWWI